MNRPILLSYLLLTGCSDTLTGALLIMAPDFTLQLMQLRVPPESLVFLSFIGAFVLAVGLSSLYGAYIAFQGGSRTKVEVVWLLTAFTRASVAIFVVQQVLALTLDPAWLAVATADSTCVLIQAVGLYRGWLANLAR